MSRPNKTEYYWWPRQIHTVPTIAVTDEHADARREREEKAKSGAHVVPFGFGRVLTPPPVEHVEREPQTWEGDGA